MGQWKPSNTTEWITDQDKKAARNAGGLAALSEQVPIGSILLGGWLDIPDGLLPCNGQLLSRVGYPNLYSEIGTQFGVGDGSTTFAAPKLTAPAAGLTYAIRY